MSQTTRCLSAAKGLFEFVTKAFAANEQDRPECCQLGLLCAVKAGIAIAGPEPDTRKKQRSCPILHT